MAPEGHMRTQRGGCGGEASEGTDEGGVEAVGYLFWEVGDGRTGGQEEQERAGGLWRGGSQAGRGGRQCCERQAGERCITLLHWPVTAFTVRPRPPVPDLFPGSLGAPV